MNTKVIAQSVVALCVFQSMKSWAEEPKQTPVEKTGFVEIVINPPFHSQNWETPRKLLFSQLHSIAGVAKNQLFSPRDRKSSLGHALVHFRCEGSSGPVEDWTGFSGEDSGQGPKLIFLQGAGLGLMLYGFDDGHVQTADFVKDYLKDASHPKKNQPRLHFLKLPVSRQECDMMKCHLNAFREAKKPVYYGFISDPAKYEGAGCTSYAASYLQVAGMKDPIFDRWIRNLAFTSKLVGTKTLQPELGQYPIDPKQPKRVGPLKVIRPFRKSAWHVNNYADYKLDIYDPELMAGFMEAVAACSEGKSSCQDPELREWSQRMGARVVYNPMGRAVELTNYSYSAPEEGGSTACSMGDKTPVRTVAQQDAVSVGHE